MEVVACDCPSTAGKPQGVNMCFSQPAITVRLQSLALEPKGLGFEFHTKKFCSMATVISIFKSFIFVKKHNGNLCFTENLEGKQNNIYKLLNKKISQ